MDTALWIVQALLAIAFAVGGLGKLTQPKENLAPRQPYVEDFSAGAIKAIGLAEVLAAIGLIAPRLTGTLPWLTPLAGAGLVALMLGAMATHLRRREYPNLAVNLVLLTLATFVAYGRFATA